MAVHLQDEQEIANFKYFWQRWGKWVFALLLVAALAYLAYVLYQSHERGNGEKAAGVFETFATQYQANNDAGAKKALLQLQQDYPKTIPAAQATLMMAGVAFDQGKYDDAIKHLQWVGNKQKSDFIQALVAQRLAVVYLQQQKYDQALAALDVKVADPFKPTLLETRGDILVAQQKNKEAVAAYDGALKLLPKEAPQRQVVQMKADSLR